MKRQSVASLEYTEVPVIARADPTDLPVSMAFVAEDVDPDRDSDFNVGSWDTDAGEVADRTWIARCLVGPGAVELELGIYDTYVLVDGDPESPVLLAGKLKIF